MCSLLFDKCFIATLLLMFDSYLCIDIYKVRDTYIAVELSRKKLSFLITKSVIILFGIIQVRFFAKKLLTVMNILDKLVQQFPFYKNSKNGFLR